MPVGLRSRVPEKMTSSIREPRRVFADCSPSTQEIASAMLDLPQPLGPMIAATPSPWNFSSVRSQNDLNPRIWSRFSLSNLHSLRTPLGLAESTQVGQPSRLSRWRQPGRDAELSLGWTGGPPVPRELVRCKSFSRIYQADSSAVSIVFNPSRAGQGEHKLALLYRSNRAGVKWLN